MSRSFTEIYITLLIQFVKMCLYIFPTIISIFLWHMIYTKRIVKITRTVILRTVHIPISLCTLKFNLPASRSNSVDVGRPSQKV